MNILLLPGMDGTGIMFEPFVKLLPSAADIQIANLIQETGVSFEDQAKELVRDLKKDTIIIGESYSGLIAHEIGKIAPDSIKHIVFAASFLEQPSLLAKFGNLVPKGLLNYSLYPELIVKKMLFGRYCSQYLMNLFYRAMADVSLDLLEYRLKQLSNLPPIDTISSIPSSYLQANDDRLVSESASKVFKKTYLNIEVKKLDGSHFVLQTNPRDCLRVVLANSA